MKKVLKLFLTLAMGLITVSGIAACGGAGNPSTADPNGQSQADGGNDNSDVGQYSEVLQTVLNSSEYDEIIEAYYSFNSKAIDLMPIPWEFIKNSGHDVDYVKSKGIAVYNRGIYNDVYTIDNDVNSLYVAMRVRNEAATDYYTNYVLKYSISDKEYEDLNMLFGGEYIQAPFFVQELAKTRQPEIQSKVNLTVDSYDKIYNNMTTNGAVLNLMEDDFLMSSVDIDVIKIDESTKDLLLTFREASTNKTYNKACNLKYLDMTVSSYINVNNNIYEIVSASIKSIDTDAYNAPANSHKINYFDSLHFKGYYKNLLDEQ